MKLEPGVPLYLERFVARAFAVLGVLLLATGLVLFLFQAYLYVELGIWGKLPASSLFVEPRTPVDELQVSKDIEKLRSPTGAPVQRQLPGKHSAADFFIDPSPTGVPVQKRQLPASARELIVYERLYSVIPDWFRSKTSWLADPDHLYGLHNIVIWLLDFVSISVFLLLVGTTILAISLRDSLKDAAPVSREHTT